MNDLCVFYRNHHGDYVLLHERPLHVYLSQEPSLQARLKGYAATACRGGGLVVVCQQVPGEIVECGSG